jgi:hypothetical protein
MSPDAFSSASEPNVIVPRASVETAAPLLPRVVNFMEMLLQDAD